MLCRILSIVIIFLIKGLSRVTVINFTNWEKIETKTEINEISQHKVTYEPLTCFNVVVSSNFCCFYIVPEA